MREAHLHILSTSASYLATSLTTLLLYN